MHYTLAQCQELARTLLEPQRSFEEPQPSHNLVLVNLEHEMPWPSDDQIKMIMIEEAKSKKEAAKRLGITRRCLRRRLKEMKELGVSAGNPCERLTVRNVLIRLNNNQTFQQISNETEVHQAWLCRLLSNLIIAHRQRYDIPDLKPRTSRAPRTMNQARYDVQAARDAMRQLSQIAATNITSRSVISTSSWLPQSVNSTNNIWITSDATSSNGTVEYVWDSFTGNDEDVSCNHDNAQEASENEDQAPGPEASNSDAAG